eukprot:scaffold284022_cov15-Tisochrysis_lutea.AAC.1
MESKVVSRLKAIQYMAKGGSRGALGFCMLAFWKGALPCLKGISFKERRQNFVSSPRYLPAGVACANKVYLKLGGQAGQTVT